MRCVLLTNSIDKSITSVMKVNFTPQNMENSRQFSSQKTQT